MSAVPYQTIVADPPWAYDVGDFTPPASLTKSGRREKKHMPSETYQRLSIPELEALPVKGVGDQNAHLYLWTTNAFIEPAHSVARAWGFTPKTVCTWVKVHNSDPCRVSMKTGFYFRGATEHWLFCVRGSLRLQVSEALPTAYLWPRLPHSVKPDAFYDLVETASPGPRLELFSRRARFGWDYWGDQSLGTAELEGAQ